MDCRSRSAKIGTQTVKHMEIRTFHFRCVVRTLLLAIGVPGLSVAATYYVTQSGAGSKNGTSLANAWSVANYNASGTPTGGDTIYFSGTITSTVVPGKSGTGNGNGRLTLDFSGAALTAPALSFSNISYLTLNGGTIAAGTDGVSVISCAYVSPGVGHDITIQNFAFTGAAGGNSTFFSVGSCTNVLIQNNKADNVLSFVNEWQGMTHDITILNNYARTSVNITQQSDLITLGDSQAVLIQGNYLENRSPGSQSNSRHNDIIQTFQSGSSRSQTPSGWTIAYNWVVENVTDCAHTDGSNSWTMIEGTGGTNYLYGNVFYAPGSCSFGNGQTMDSNQSSVVWYVYNNTYASPHGYPGIWFQNSGNLYFRNNVFQMSGGNGTYLVFNWNAGATWDYNFLYGVPDCSSKVTGSHGSCSTNPSFANFSGGDFSFSAGSPLLNAGDSTIGATYTQGIASGSVWPAPFLAARAAGTWDVGAYEHGNSITSGSAPAPPSQLTVVAVQ